jgi:hypothetical protein
VSKRASDARFGFVIARSRLEHHRRDVARFVCARCPIELEVAPTWPLNPEAVAKRASAYGWRVDAYRKSEARCPDCQARRSPGDRPDPKPPAPPQTAKVIPMTVAAIDPKPKAQPPEPTKDQRLKIRALLDKHFDDHTGAYLDSYSDQRIGEEVGIAWAAVARIREAAYGPIRVDPEVAGLRAELKALHQAIERGQKGLDDLKALAAGVSNRLAVLEAKRSAA